MWQTIIELITKLFVRDGNAQIKQAEAVVKMTMELALEFKQRLEDVEQQMAEQRREMDNLKAEYFKADGTISDLQRQIKENRQQLKEYQAKLREYERKSHADEQTIVSLRKRIEELEARQGDSNAG